MKTSDIRWVKAHVTDNGEGFAYLYCIKYNDMTMVEYINYDEQGRTVQEVFPLWKLPYHVRKWLDTHDREVFDVYDGVVTYIYR